MYSYEEQNADILVVGGTVHDRAKLPKGVVRNKSGTSFYIKALTLTVIHDTAFMPKGIYNYKSSTYSKTCPVIVEARKHRMVQQARDLPTGTKTI
jgi:hypothetical protein